MKPLLHQIRLQYITHPYLEKSALEMGLALLKIGVPWIQYRDKESSDEVFVRNALHLKKQCALYSSVFIINDRVHLFEAIQPDGVHIGASDGGIGEVRTTIGQDALLGYTVNNQADLSSLAHQHQKVDYVGLGALHQTQTKTLNSTPLGYEQWPVYRQKIKSIAPNLPVVAVGGITLADFPKLREIEANGVAVSKGLHTTKDPLVYIQLSHHLF